MQTAFVYTTYEQSTWYHEDHRYLISKIRTQVLNLYVYDQNLKSSGTELHASDIRKDKQMVTKTRFI